MQEMKLIDAVAAETAIKDFFKKQIDEEYLYLEVTDCNADISAILNALPEIPAVPLEVHERMKRELNEEIEKQSQNIKVLVSDHRTLQQSFDNLKSLYEAEKAKVEKAKEKCIYFANEVHKARAETDRMTALAAEWKDAAYTYADNIDRIKAEAIKEFAERIDTHFKGSGIHWLYEASLKQRIDNLVKEMAGEH